MGILFRSGEILENNNRLNFFNIGSVMVMEFLFLKQTY